MQNLIGVLISLLIAGLVLGMVVWIIGLIPGIPPVFKQIAMAIIGLVFLLWILAHFVPSTGLRWG